MNASKKHGNLPWLLAVVLGLLLLRWLAPPNAARTLEVVEPTAATAGDRAVDHAKAQVVQADAVPAANGQPAMETGRTAPMVSPAPVPGAVVGAVEAAGAVDLAGEPGLGNAFAVRRSQAAAVEPAVVTIARAPVAPAVADTQPPPAPPAPPPLQIIGTWDDGASPGVFIATPQATVLARKDTVLMSDYKVVAVTPQAVSLVQISSQTPWTLVVPQNAPRPQPAATAPAQSHPTRSNP